MQRLSRVRLFVLIVATAALLPSRWWASAGAPAVAHAQAAAGQAAALQTFEGILNVNWGDPQRGSSVAGGVKYTLALPDGSVIPLQLAGQENVAVTYFGKPVAVTGRQAARPATTTGTSDVNVLVVDSIGPARTSAQGAAPDVSGAFASGTKKVLFLLLKFQDDTAVPHPASFFLNLTNPDTPSAGIPATINGFFKKTSNNKFSWIGDVGGAGGIGAPGGWLTLPHPKSFYAPCGFDSSCLNTASNGPITTDAVAAAAAAGISLVPYDNINFVFSNDLDCCAWGGGVSINGKFYGATWAPPWAQETDVYSHELGHSLGLPHSGWLYFAYDSPWDVMSDDFGADSRPCGSYTSRNGGGLVTLTCREPGGGYIAAHREYLGWIVGTNVVETSWLSDKTVTLEGASLPIGTSPKMIRICVLGYYCTGNSAARYFTVEARIKSEDTSTQFDNGIPGDGVIIHEVQMNRPPISGPCFFNNQSGWAVPVDATPGDYDSTVCDGPGVQFGLYNAQFTVGQTYTDNTYGFRVSVLSRTASTFTVSVQGFHVPSDVSLDSPASGSAPGRPFTVKGWAINRFAPRGTGVDAVHVYAAPVGGGAAIFLGAAAYGSARGDVAAIYGAEFINSGFTLSTGASLPPGSYNITAYAHDAETGGYDASRSATITLTGPASNGLMNIDSPTPAAVVTSAFEVGGWAIDTGAPTGTGVDAVQFYVFPNDGASPGVFIGSGSHGGVRTDVGGIYGSRFTNSGYHFTITGLGPGNFLLGVYAHSTLTGTYSIVKTLHFTVNANALMSIDVPTAESTITTPTFNVSGWAIDRAIESTATPGTGVDTLHVYAYPNPGSGAAPIFLGVATVGFARSDVAGIYGSRYASAGYNLAVSAAAAGLTPGIYSIAVHAHSTASGAFNNSAVMRVTIQ